MDLTSGNDSTSAGNGNNDHHQYHDICHALQYVLTVEDFDSDFLHQIGTCNKCSGSVRQCQRALNVCPGRCILLSCNNVVAGEKCPNWFACLECEKRLDKRRVRKHFQSRSHHDCLMEITRREATRLVADFEDKCCDAGEDTMPLSGEDECMSELQVMDPEESMESSIDLSTGQPEGGAVDCKSLDGKQETHLAWLQKIFDSTNKSTVFKLWECFQEQTDMFYFCLAQNSKDNGGLQFLCARTFTRTEYIELEALPSLEEAKYHIMSFIQYISMGEKQRRRQAHITKMLLSNFGSISTSGLLYINKVLNYQDLN